MRRERGFANVLIVIVIVIVSTGAALYFFQTKSTNQLEKDNIIPVEGSAQQESNNDISDETKTKLGANFDSQGKFVFSTRDWNGYSTKDTKATFSISYPINWKLNTSVFDDESGKKVAEFAPGLVILQPGQECFDVKDDDYSPRSKIISESVIKIANKRGSLRIMEVIYEGETSGTWYPWMYCLMEDDVAFVMTFYDYSLEHKNANLYEEILSTLEFN